MKKIKIDSVSLPADAALPVDTEIEVIVDGTTRKLGQKAEKLKHLSYKSYLEEAQKFIATNYAAVFSDTGKKHMLGEYIKKFRSDHRYIVDGVNDSELAAKLYRDMAEYSVLTDYLADGRTDIEEVDVNAWDDITVSYDNGSVIKLSETFYSQQHATDVIKRMLQQSGMVLDMAKPIVRGFLGTNKRITVVAAPVVDGAVGITASIRVINPKHMQRADFLDKNTATEEMLDFLVDVLKYRISICIAGETNTGKTTIMSYILSCLEDSKRIITIEEDVREFDLIKYDENGRKINNVIHMVTRKSDNDKEIVSAEKLLETALTMNPDTLCVAEMKSTEAYAAQEAARTGHAVIATTHANSAEATYDRMCTLCITKYPIEFGILSRLVREAFPIVFYIKRFEDKCRRITKICECEIQGDGSFQTRPLWQFFTQSNESDAAGNCVVKGEYKKTGVISNSLYTRLIENGMPLSRLESLKVMPLD